jgi:quercetin dioxygenase-like cupin family protein
MKQISLYAMAILLVPWTACENQSPSPIASNTVVETTKAGAILPPAQDTILPSGRKNIYLVGRRDSPGFFVERSIFPSGYKGLPHIHNADIYITILSGSAYLVMGNKFDTTVDSRPYGPGSFLVIPAEQAHYEWFPEECVIQIEGIGPNETFFVNSGNPK